MAVIADFAAYPEWADQVKTRRGARHRTPRAAPSGSASRWTPARSRTPTRSTTRGRPTAGRSAGRWSRGRSRRRRTARTRSSATGPPTTVTYSLAVDLNIPMIGMLRRKAEKVIIDTALKGLKRRVEALPTTQSTAITLAGAGRAVHGQGWGRQDDPRRGDGRPPRPVRAARRWSSPPTPRTPSATRWRPTSAASRPRWTGSAGCSPPTSTPAPCSTARGGRCSEHLRTVLAGAGVDELVADELTVLPGVEELLALAAVRRAAESGPWEVVVVDCGPDRRDAAAAGAARGGRRATWSGCSPPTGGPCAGCWRACPAGGRDAAAGWDPTADALDGLADELAGLRAMLAAARAPSIRLVLTPERVVAAETRRTLTALALHGLRVDGLVVEPGRAGAAAVAARAPRRAGCASAHTEQAGRARRAGRAGGRAAVAPSTTPPPSPPAWPRCWSWPTTCAATTTRPRPGSAGPPLLRVRRTRGRGHVGGLGVRAGAAPARCRRRPARPGPVGDELAVDGRRGAPAGGAAVGAAPVHGHRGPAGRRRPVRGVPPGPGAVWTGGDEPEPRSGLRRARRARRPELRDARAQRRWTGSSPCWTALRIEPPTADGRRPRSRARRCPAVRA